MNKRTGFTLVEVLIAVAVLAIALGGIYISMNTAAKAADRATTQALSSHIGNENLELFRYVRNSNWISGNDWLDKWDTGLSADISDGYYVVYLDRTNVKMEDIRDNFDEAKLDSRLYVDSSKNFTYEDSGNTESNYYSFIQIESFNGDTENRAKKITSYFGKYHEPIDKSYTISTIITNWK